MGTRLVLASSIRLATLGPLAGSTIGRNLESPANSGQWFRHNFMNSLAIFSASSFESAFKMAHPPMTSLLSGKGPSVRVIFPRASRMRNPSLLGKRPPVSTRAPSLGDF